jgi:hypothetical protein
MNRFVFLGLALAIALAGPVSAGTMFRYIRPPALNLSRAAGEISEDGRVVRGQGFTVRHLSVGVYEITFNPGYFPSGCAAMAITDEGILSVPPIGEVQQARCDGRFHVVYHGQIGGRTDQAFQFVAIEEAM